MNTEQERRFDEEFPFGDGLGQLQVTYVAGSHLRHPLKENISIRLKQFLTQELELQKQSFITMLEGMKLGDNGCTAGCGLDEEERSYNQALANIIKKLT